MLLGYSSLLNFLRASWTLVLCVTEKQRGCASAALWTLQTWGFFTILPSPLLTADLPADLARLACLPLSPKVCSDFSPSLLITKTQLEAAECKPAAKHKMKGKSARRWGQRLRKRTLDLGHGSYYISRSNPSSQAGLMSHTWHVCSSPPISLVGTGSPSPVSSAWTTEEGHGINASVDEAPKKIPTF